MNNFDLMERKRISMTVKEINHEIMKILLIATILLCNAEDLNI